MKAGNKTSSHSTAKICLRSHVPKHTTNLWRKKHTSIATEQPQVIDERVILLQNLSTLHTSCHRRWQKWSLIYYLQILLFSV